MTTLIEKIKPASLENYELKNLISKRKQKKGRVLTNDLLQKCSRRLPYSCEKKTNWSFCRRNAFNNCGKPTPIALSGKFASFILKFNDKSEHIISTKHCVKKKWSIVTSIEEVKWLVFAKNELDTVENQDQKHFSSSRPIGILRQKNWRLYISTVFYIEGAVNWDFEGGK